MPSIGRKLAPPLLTPVAPRVERSAPALLLLVLAVYYLGFAYATYAGARGLHDGLGVLIGRDFIVYWSAASLTLAGQAASVFDADLFHRFQLAAVGPAVLDPQGLTAAGGASAGQTMSVYPWLYPPHALLYVLPLGLLPYLWSYGAWCAGTLALYLLAACGWRWGRPQALALVLAPATMANAFVGQNGFLSAALLVGGLRLVDRRPVLAGVLLGLLCFKPQLGLLVPVALAAARLWRPFASAAATGLAVAGLSVAVFGPESWMVYLERTTGYQAQVLNQDGGWFLNIAVTPFVGGRLLGLETAARAAVQALFTLGAMVGVYVAFRARADRKLQTAVLLAGVLLASPYGYHYDLPLVSVAVLWVYAHGARTGFLPGEQLLLALVWILPLVVVVANPLGLPVAPAILALFFGLALARARGVTAGAAARSPAPGHG